MRENHQNERPKAERPKPQGGQGKGDDRTPDKTIGQIAYAGRPKQLDEGKPGRDPGNELSAGTDPSGKTEKEGS